MRVQSIMAHNTRDLIPKLTRLKKWTGRDLNPRPLRKKDKWMVLFDYFRSDIIAGPSGLAVISLQKEDSLLVILIVMDS